MTSWNSPTHSIKLNVVDINSHALAELSGNCFSVSILRRDKKRPIHGMVSISMMSIKKIESDISQEGALWARLWIDSPKSIIPLQQPVSITLVEECDPMYQEGSEKEEVKKLLPISLSGEIHQITSISDEEIQNIKKFLKKGSE